MPSEGTTGPGGAVCWRVSLLGRIHASRDSRVLERFPTRASALLLARLSLAPQRLHPREELIELLWPGVALAVGRNRLRQALSTLKRLLEPGREQAPVLLADRAGVRVRPGALECDVLRFEELARSGRNAAAHELYCGELMPGSYEEWVVDERRRLAELFERVDAALRTSARHAEEGARPPSGLPNYWTAAFGMEADRARLQALVRTQRLVTVHGPGGCGKTRLAVETARGLLAAALPGSSEAASRGFERVVFVPLAECTSATQMREAVCSSLRIAGGNGSAERIVAALEGRHVLLVLDNLEQLQAGAEAEIARWLAAAPLLHLLATSRRLLALEGEHAFELNGLELPAAGATPRELEANPAVALFVDRARAARARFRPGPRDAEAVASITRILGGMPLAIELAASRMRALTPALLALRLSEGVGAPTLDLLTRGSSRGGVDSRHASMRRVIEWSWRQLPPEHRALLATIAVLPAPALKAAVAAVAGLPQRTIEPLLDEWRDASLLRQWTTDGEEARFGLLQPVREFAAGQLAPAQARASRRRLREWLIERASRIAGRDPVAFAPDGPLAVAAIVHAVDDGAPGDGLRLAVAMRPYWDSNAPALSVIAALEQALRSGPVADGDLVSDAHELLALGRGQAGFAAEAIEHAERAVEAATDARRRSLALTRLAWARYTAGHFDALLDATLDDALHAAEHSADPYAMAMALRMLSVVTCNIRFDFARTEWLATQAQALFEQVGNRPLAYLSLLNRAMMWGKIGRGNEQAIEVIAECERATRKAGDWAGSIMVARQLGRVLLRERRWTEAAGALRRSVTVAWQRDSVQGVAHALLHLPMPVVMTGQARRAALLLGFAVPHWLRHFHGINRIEARELVRTRRMLRLVLGPAQAETLRLEGSGLNKADAVRLALQEDAA